MADEQIRQNAISIGRYFTKHSKAAFSLMVAGALVMQCRYVLGAVCKSGMVEFTRRDVTRQCRSFKTAYEVQPVLNHLQSMAISLQRAMMLQPEKVDIPDKSGSSIPVSTEKSHRAVLSFLSQCFRAADMEKNRE